MSDAFDFVTLSPGTTAIGPLRITTAHMNHPVETFGFRIEHAGQVLAYSADTAPSGQLVELAAGADVLLCEASFLDGPGLPATAAPDRAGGGGARGQGRRGAASC